MMGLLHDDSNDGDRCSTMQEAEHSSGHFCGHTGAGADVQAAPRSQCRTEQRRSREAEHPNIMPDADDESPDDASPVQTSATMQPKPKGDHRGEKHQMSSKPETNRSNSNVNIREAVENGETTNNDLSVAASNQQQSQL